MKTVFDLLNQLGLALESDAGVVLLFAVCAMPLLFRLHAVGVLS